MSEAPKWVTMTDGEEIIWNSKPSKIPYFQSLVGGILIIAVGFAVWFTGGLTSILGVSFQPDIPIIPLPFWDIVAIVLLLWGGNDIVKTFLDWWNVHYVLTSEEIYKKTGIISRTIKNTRLSQVQNTSLSQSRMGRLGSFGNVRIDTAGTGGKEIIMRHVDNPSEIVEKITRQMSKSLD